MRHIKTDVRCLHEQAASRVLPLTKLFGAQNTVDLITKNLTAGVTQESLTNMKLTYAEGRSDIAQQLHSFSGADRCGLRGKGRLEMEEVVGLEARTSCNIFICENTAWTSCNNLLCACCCLNVDGAMPLRCTVNEGILDEGVIGDVSGRPVPVGSTPKRPLLRKRNGYCILVH